MNYSHDPEIEAASSLVVAALQEFYEQGDKKTKNPYEGMSYVLRRKCFIEKSCRRKGDLMESKRSKIGSFIGGLRLKMVKLLI